MGLENRMTGKTFVNIFNGKFVIRTDEKTPGAISRLNKNNKKVWELHYNNLKGVLTSITKKAHDDFGMMWEIQLTDDKDYVLNIPYGGGQSFKFFTKVMMVPDIDAPIEVGVQLTDEKTQFFISQNGASMKTYWNKDNKRDLPELKIMKFKGKDQYDDTDQMAYIEAFLDKHLIPKLKTLNPAGDGPKDDTDEEEAHKNFQPTSKNSFKDEGKKGSKKEDDADLPDWAKEVDDLPFK